MNPFQMLMQFLQGGGAQAAPSPFAGLLPGDRPLENPNDPPPAPPPPPPPVPGPTAPAQGIPGVRPPVLAAETGWGAGLNNTLKTLGMGGQPTAQEYQYGVGQQKLEMEQGQREAMAALAPEIARIRESNPGAQPHEIMRQVMASPTFAQSALKVPAPEMQKFISGLVQETQKPAPTPFAQGNAYGTRDPVTGQVSIQGMLPTSEMQTQQWLLGLTPEQRLEIQNIKQARNSPSEKAAALERLVASRVIDRATADKVLGGLIFAQTDPVSGTQQRADLTQIGPAAVPPSSGAMPTGQQPAPQAGAPQTGPRIAQAQGEPPPMPPPAPAAPPGTAPLPGQEPAPFDPNMPAGTYSSLLPNPADMVDALNWPGALANIVGKVSGQFDPKAVDPKLAAQVNALAHYRKGVQDLNGRARQLKVEHELYDALADAPNTIGGNSMEGAVKGLQLREKLDQREIEIRRELARARAGQGVKGQAEKYGEELRLIEGFKRYTATAEQWKEKIATLQKGEGGPDWGAPLRALPGADAVQRTFTQGQKGKAERDARPPTPTGQQPPQENAFTRMDEKALLSEGQRILRSGTPEERKALRDEIARRKGAQ